MNPRRPLALALVLGFGLGGCADRNKDDHDRKEMWEDYAELQVVSGEYYGMARLRDGSEGTFGIKLEPEVRSVVANGETKREAYLKGVLIFLGPKPFTLQLRDSSYEESDGTFVARAIVSAAASSATGSTSFGGTETATISVTSHIENGRLTGRLEADGYTQYGISFDLNKNVALPADSAKSGLPLERFQIGNRLYKGRIVDTGGYTADVTLSYGSGNLTNEGNLLDVLRPVRVIQAVWDFGNAINVVFPNSTLDESAGTLQGRLITSISGDMAEFSLNCKRIDTAKGKGWECDYFASRVGRPYHVKFEPVTTASGKVDP